MVPTFVLLVISIVHSWGPFSHRLVILSFLYILRFRLLVAPPKFAKGSHVKDEKKARRVSQCMMDPPPSSSSLFIIILTPLPLLLLAS